MARRPRPLLAFAIGLYLALRAPDDYQQGATVKIMFIHVPSAWLGMFVLGADEHRRARHAGVAPSARRRRRQGRGADRRRLHALCLVTGSLWGRPMWGTYWVWDARLTSVLVLFLMYLGVIALWRTVEDPSRAARAAAILTLVGADQPADHQVLGRLVEHAAPAGLGDAARRPDHPSDAS